MRKPKLYAVLNHDILNLKVIQAEFGDCMILEFGTASETERRHYFLIDGGPSSTYEKYLKKELIKLRDNQGKLDLIIVSHIDNDHINGLLKLMVEIREQIDKNSKQTVDIEAFWYNAFSRTIGRGNDIENRLNTIMKRNGGAKSGIESTFTDRVTKGVREGNDLNMYAHQLGIPINPDFNSDTITIDGTKKMLEFENLRVHIVGPSEKNLDDLRKEWLEWLEKYEKSIIEKDHRKSVPLDRSIPNLSSVMFLVEEKNKRILFTGDGLGDHIIEGLEQHNLLDSEGRIKVDVLKLPHHGSERNVTMEFFKSVIADKYVISANGRDDNPSLSTLIWIAQNAKADHRSIEIIITNNSSNVQRFAAEYPPKKYGYKLKILKRGTPSINVSV